MDYKDRTKGIFKDTVKVSYRSKFSVDQIVYNKKTSKFGVITHIQLERDKDGGILHKMTGSNSYWTEEYLEPVDVGKFNRRSLK